MYDFIVSNIDKIPHIDEENGVITTVKGTNGTVSSTTGYLMIKLNEKTVQVHQIFAVIYFGKECIGKQVNHKDGKQKTNNRKDNLEVCTQRENIKHEWENGLCDNKWARKFSNQEIRDIRNSYKPRDREFSIPALSKKFNCNRKTMERIIKKHSYKDVE